MRDRIQDKEFVRQLERAYERGNLHRAAELAAQLTGLVPVCGEARHFLSELRDHAKTAEPADILLAIYVLHAGRAGGGA